MSSNPLIQYWDSMVIIHRLQRTPEYINDLEQLTADAENGKLKILLSTYSVAEVIKDPDGGMLSEEEEQKINDLFENPYFIIRPLTLPIAILSRKISRQFGIKPKDAVHIATAVYWKCPTFVTCEDKLLNKTGLIGTPPLIIEKPKWRGQQTLVPEANGHETSVEEQQAVESNDREIDLL